jgi:hypothetical protein
MFNNTNTMDIVRKREVCTCNYLPCPDKKKCFYNVYFVKM